MIDATVELTVRVVDIDMSTCVDLDVTMMSLNKKLKKIVIFDEESSVTYYTW